MSVLTFADVSAGKIKKSSLEAIYYAKQIAAKTGGKTIVLLYKANEDAIKSAAQVGADKIINIQNDINEVTSDAMVVAKIISKYATAEGCKNIVLPYDIHGKATASSLSGILKCAVVSAVTNIPEVNGNAFLFKKNVFSGKAFSTMEVGGDVKVITFLPNSFQFQMNTSATPEVVNTTTDLSGIVSKIKVKEVQKNDNNGSIPLPEADLVVSGGRGLKGPENWNIIEDLAKALGATTACSRPVADMHWRPHHEHVGQTGLAIRPNLYIAIGISGAIQHLAGVSGSKTIVVINNDKEAPFFKSADYGIVGDAFAIVPKLTEAIKKFKSSQH